MKSELEILTEICEKEGYKVKKELECHCGYEYCYYAVKEDKKFQIGFIGNFGNRGFLTVDELKNKLN